MVRNKNRKSLAQQAIMPMDLRTDLYMSLVDISIMEPRKTQINSMLRMHIESILLPIKELLRQELRDNTWILERYY